jgi:hypothetical protein
MLEVDQADYPRWKKLEFVTELVVAAKGVANYLKFNQLSVSQGPMVPVVNVFCIVFPEELLGMPPNRYIKFVNDLMLGTVPIC